MKIINDNEKYAEDYTISLNNLEDSLSAIGETQEAITLEKECLEILKELYSKNKEKWLEDYTSSLNNLAVSYYKDNQRNKSLELFNINYEIHKEHYGENDERTLEVLSNIKIVNLNSFKREATIIDLLYIFKYISVYNQEEEINENSFLQYPCSLNKIIKITNQSIFG